MVEPVSMLGGAALGVAKIAITKWVGGQIAAGIDLALRNRQLRQGRPSKDQQVELSQVLKTAVELTAADLYEGDSAVQRQFVKQVCRGKRRDWPLVNGSDLDDLVGDVAVWVAQVDPQSAGDGASIDPDSHPYLALLCEHAVAQFGFRAENNGMRNSILFPRWNRFCRDELLLGVPAAMPRPEPGQTVNNTFGTVGTLVQASTVTINTGSGQKESAPWPRRLGSLPPLAIAHLDRPIDRDLASALAEGGTALVCQILAGGGGIGKTQAAAAYAHDRWRRGDVDLLIWVNAATRASITAAFAQAGAEYCGVSEDEGERAAERFLAWLDGPAAPRWLIVLDDVNETADVHGLWPPTNPMGRTIVTTRLRESALDGDGRARIDVGHYTPEQARQYLSDRLGERADLLDGADELAEALGYLPLGLAQAAAYMLDQPGFTCRRYVSLLAQHDQPLAGLAPRTFSAEYPQSLDAALVLSIDRAAGYEPPGLANALLRFASLLDPAGIPAALFTNEQVRRHFIANTATRLRLARLKPVPPRMVEDMLAQLHRLNLIDHDGTLVRMHALTQRACRDRTDPRKRDAIALVAANALVDLWSQIENNPIYSALLRANTAQLRDLTEPVLLRNEAHPVLFRQGKSLGETGLVHEAVAHFEALHQLCDSDFGPDHPDTLATRNNLAYWRGKAGDAAGAATATEALLQDQVRVLGPDHPDTLTTRNNLAVWRGEAGGAAGAATAFGALLEDRLRVVGPDHPDTPATRSNLAYWRGEAGGAAGAATAFGALLEDRLRVVGPDHPDTLATRSNLAYWRGKAGGAAGAATATEALLQDQVRVLGPDHPATSITRNNLAYWRGEAGDAAGAATEFGALLEDRLRVVGPDHPDTLATRNNLVSWRGQAGDAAGAATATEALLQDQVRVLGPDHPATFITRNNLAYWRGEAGDAAGAATATEALLQDQLRVLGPDHPATFITRTNLAYWRGEAGAAAGAATEFGALLEDRLRVLGPDHPDTLNTRSNLAYWRGEAGDAAGAATAFEALLEDSLRVLGPDHPATFITRNNLAYWRERANPDS
ncbi:tetratricopeptide repeat protein [Glycomyces buryatensis]|uniref:Tetratricopeptide repeat protein n=1 Tax=Glycomyces buryatensis TaxID=2570927 RepID=A0A4S8Q0Y0_9ACTN|nr:tetratricopeptide repeat protein [Glycomyces buryatensis]THV37757.1 tetratricopeptide repeat protein [Glycomyces buryatensis]